VTDETPSPPDASGPRPVPQLPAAPAPQAAPARPRRRSALAAAAVLVAAAAGGGLGYAALQDSGAGPDSKAAADTPWTAPSPSATKAFGARSGGSHYGSLRLLLLPVPEQFGPGPDVERFGNDVVLDARQAASLFKGDIGELSAKARRSVDAAVDALHIQGAGLRTYAERNNQLVIQITLVQMKNKQAARAETKYFAEFTKAMGLFRTGPEVPGHEHAACFLPPKESGDKLDSMYCQDTEGDLMVTMTASGTMPLAKTEAVGVLRDQLDRVKDPGTAV
jgi:hypothetical protein